MDQPTADRIATALERIAAANEEQTKISQACLEAMNYNHEETMGINRKMLDRVSEKTEAEEDLEDARDRIAVLAQDLGFKLADEEE